VVDLILPVLDEAAAIPQVLARVPAGFHVIVVDNGSEDDSADVACGLGAEVVREVQRGFGAACATGLAAASHDVVAFMDCDGSLDPRELERVVAPVAADESELMLGARIAEPGAWPLHARLANRALTFELRRRCATKLSDLGPMRAAGRETLIGLGIRDRRFGWPLEMVLRAANAGWRIGEADVSYHPRVGRSKVTGTVRGTARAITDMAQVLT